FATMGPAAVPELLRHAGDGHEPTRAVVAKALGLLRTPDAVEPLIGLTADPSEAVRAAAVEGLGAIPDGLTRNKDRPPGRPCRGRWRVARLLRRLRLPNRFTEAAEPVPRLKPAEVVPACVAALRKAVQDDSPLVRSEAVAALGRIGGPAGPAAGDLTSALSADADEIRRRAAVSLGLVRADALLAVPSLTVTLQDPS